MPFRQRTNFLRDDRAIVMLLALANFLLHLLTNNQYGFHRDELDILDNARYLAWGYVAYPPLVPFLARIVLELFGASLVSVRLFAALAASSVMLLTGLMARELGGSRTAQIVAAIAAGIAPFSLLAGTLMIYSPFDFLWWVLTAYFVIRLMKSDDSRWWFGIGTAIGLGMLTKYSIAFFVMGLIGGWLLTNARRQWRDPWMWGGIALAFLIFLPNLIWQFQNNFISLDFLSFIHARDVRIGRADGFLIEQMYGTTNPVTIPFWIAGLVYFFSAAGKKYRILGWTFIFVFALLVVTKGRSYYSVGAYPMLFATGAVAYEHWLGSLTNVWARFVQVVTWVGFAIGSAFIAITLPIAPPGSGWFDFTAKVHDTFTEEVGWDELTETVAGIYNALPAEEKSRTGIFAGNYGEAGALNLFGRAYGLPRAISGINSYWERGYGNPSPQTVIVVGEGYGFVTSAFESCQLAGRNTNRYRVINEESRDHPDIFVCRNLREPWDVFWKKIRHYG